MFNILLITADHMRHDAVAYNAKTSHSSSLSHVVSTPNLDRLAAAGFNFVNSFTPDPVCVPARASITTGNYPHRCWGLKTPGRIGDGRPKLAEIFSSKGYATYAIGKLHYVPYSPPGTARLLHGFQYAELNEEGRILARFGPRGEMEGLEDYHDYLRKVGWEGYERAHGIGNNDVRPTTSPLPLEYYEEAWAAKRALSVLEKHIEIKKKQPFLMWLSFSKPHSPYDPPQPYDTMYDPRNVPKPLGGWDNEEILENRDLELVDRRKMYGWNSLPPQTVQLARAHYCGLVTLQDSMIGRIIQFLERRDLIDETIVVYTADHGDLLGDFGRFFKQCMFDGAVKVPMIWGIPQSIIESKVNNLHQLVGLQDILPTLCSLAGIKNSYVMDGMDLSPFFRDPDLPGRKCMVSTTKSRYGQKAMIRTKKWKYVYSELEGIEELYEVEQINGELENCVSSQGDIAKKMRRDLICWFVKNGNLEMLTDGNLVMKKNDKVEEPEFSHRNMGWRRF